MKKAQRIWLLSLALLGLMALALASVHAAGSGSVAWTTDTMDDFAQGTMDGVDIWSAPGTARLDRRWGPAVQVNDGDHDDQVEPRLAVLLSNSGGVTKTYVLAVWEDAHDSGNVCPDVYFSRSEDGGQTWSANVMVQDPCDADDPPYDDCPALYTPDIAVRQADNSLWVVWQQDPSHESTGPDDGDIYYAVSADGGQTWSSSAAVYDGDGLQILPRIASSPSGYLYAVWEDERDDDGDIYISRFNPAVDTRWSAPIKISDDTTGAEQQRPALAVDAQGNVYVTWEDAREDVYGDVYFTRWLQGSAWDAAAWSANTRLSDASMDAGDEATLAVAAGDTLLAAWREKVGTTYLDAAEAPEGRLAPLDPTYDWQIVVARSQDQGQTWDRTVVNRHCGTCSGLPQYSNPILGVGPQDRLYVAWVYCPEATHSEDADILFAQSPDGGDHWTEPQTASWPSNSARSSTHPALAVDPNGRVVAAWDRYEVYAAGYPTNQFLPTGVYSRELDAGSTVSWGTIEWTLNTPLGADTPTGSDPVFATRSRTDEAAAWTNWYTYTASGEDIPHPDGRYLQYRVSFESDGSTTPQLDQVSITYEEIESAYQIFLPLVIKDSSISSSSGIDVSQLVETDDDILGISDLAPGPYADALAAGARVVNLEPMHTFFVLWVPEGYEEMESRRVMVIAHGHTGNAYREIGLELGFPNDPDYAIVTIQWWTGVDEQMYSAQQFYQFMDVALRYMEYKYQAQLDKCALRGWSQGSEISYEVTYLDKTSGDPHLALTISHDGGMMPDPDNMSVGKEFTRDLYDGVYGDDAFVGAHFYLYSGEEPQIGYMENTEQVLTNFGATVEKLVTDEGAGHAGFYSHPQYHSEAVEVFYRLTP